MKKSRLKTAVAAAFTLLCSSALHADSFTLLIYEPKSDIASRTDPQKAPALTTGAVEVKRHFPNPPMPPA